MTISKRGIAKSALGSYGSFTINEEKGEFEYESLNY